jgi:hypothetical protein
MNSSSMRGSRFVLLLSLFAAVSAVCYFELVLKPYQVAESAARGIPRGNLSDLYPRWVGARELLLHHRDPYGADLTREIQAGYYGRPLDPARPNDPKDQQAFAYPAYVVFVLAPTVGLPFVVVERTFLVVLILLTAASVLWWLRALAWHVSAWTKLVWIIFTLGCFPAIQGFKLQQLTLLVAALMALAMVAIARRHFVLAGVLLALATIKPQLVVLVVAWLCIWVAGNWRERRAVILSFAASMALLIGGSEILLPGWIGKFRAASADYYRYTGGGRSVLDVLLSPGVGRVLAVVLAAGVLVLLWKVRHAGETSPEFHWAQSLVLAATLAIIPMFATYNQLLLLPALMMIVRAARLLSAQSRVSRFLLGTTALAVFWPWLSAAALAIALLLLPAAVVERAWMVPLFTSLWIPVIVLAVMLAGRETLCRAES